MGARGHPDTENTPYFVTTVTQDRRPIFTSEAAAQLLVDEIENARSDLGFALLACVVMPDHLHVLLIPNEKAPLSLVVQTIKGRFARRWNLAQSRKGKVWQARYYESAVRTQAQLERWIAYIDMNPVEAGLSTSAEAYPWSSAGSAFAVDIEAFFDGTGPGQTGSLAFGGERGLEVRAVPRRSSGEKAAPA